MLFSDASREQCDHMTINRPSMRLPVSFLFSLPHSVLLGPHRCIELTPDLVLQLLSLLGLLGAELGFSGCRTDQISSAACQCDA
jgi:hypothetical protein